MVDRDKKSDSGSGIKVGPIKTESHGKPPKVPKAKWPTLEQLAPRDAPPPPPSPLAVAARRRRARAWKDKGPWRTPAAARKDRWLRGNERKPGRPPVSTSGAPERAGLTAGCGPARVLAVMSPGAWVGRDEIKRRLGGGDERLEHGRLGCWLYQRLEPRGLVERAADADWPGSDRRVLVPPWPGVLWRLTPEGERERDRLALVEMAG